MFKRALVVDEDRRVAELLREGLVEVGVEGVTVAATWQSARLAVQCRPELVFVEVVIGTTHCSAFLDMLQASGQLCEIVAMTGVASRQEVFALGGFPVARFLEKPFGTANVAALSTELWRKRSSSDWLVGAGRPLLKNIQYTYQLTNAEREVLACALARMTYDEIAMQRKVSRNTIKSQVKQLLGKCEAASLRELTRRVSPALT